MEAINFLRRVKRLSKSESIARFNNAFSISEVLDLMRGFELEQNKKLAAENKELKLQINNDGELPFIDPKPISRKRYKLVEIKDKK